MQKEISAEQMVIRNYINRIR